MDPWDGHVIDDRPYDSACGCGLHDGTLDDAAAMVIHPETGRCARCESGQRFSDLLDAVQHAADEHGGESPAVGASQRGAQRPGGGRG